MIPRAAPDTGDFNARGSAADEPAEAFEVDEPSFNPWDRTIEGLLIALLAFAPAALGAVQPWSELVVLCLAAAMLACLLVKILRDRRQWRPAWSWAHLPIALFLLLIVAQLMSFPSGAIGRISPETVRLKQELLGDLPNAGDLLRRVTVSFCPAATRHDLSLVL